MLKKQPRRILSYILILAIVLSSGPGYIALGESLYTKASSWAQPEIQKAADNGLLPVMLKGTDMTKPATREELCELAVLLYEKLGKKTLTPTSPNPFTDTRNPNILKAYGIGITTGTSTTTFSPAQTTTREQVATMFGRAIKGLYPSLDYSHGSTPVFNDQTLIASYAIDHVLFMNKQGIIKGSDGNFMPRPITEEHRKTGYGTTTREQAIAISVRIFTSYSDAPVDPQAGVSSKERLALSFIAGTPTLHTEKEKLDLIDFEKRVFRPLYKPNVILNVGEALDADGRDFTTGHYAAFIDSGGSSILPVQISLTPEILAQTSKIIWQVSKVPFDGSPTGFLSRTQPGIVLSGTISKAPTTYLNIDFSKINNSILPIIKPIKQFGSIGQLASLNLPIFQQPELQLPELQLPSLGFDPNNKTINGVGEETGPVTYYVRAYPVDSLGKSIGDTGSGIPVLYGEQLPTRPLLLQSAFLSNFKLKTLRRPGDASYGGEFHNDFTDSTEVYINPYETRYGFLPSSYPTSTQKLLLQVTLVQPTTNFDSWKEPAGLVYEREYLPDDTEFKALKNVNPDGLMIDFKHFVPTAEQLAGEKLKYYVRAVSLTKGSQPGTAVAWYTNTVSVIYGEAAQVKFYENIKIDPKIPKVVSIKYQPVKWEEPNWAMHYVVVTQPTYKDVFGEFIAEMTGDPDRLYEPYKVGTKIDFTPQPEEKSWWEEAWDAITDFVNNVVELVKSVVNWVSATFDKIKSGLINAVLSALDLPEPFNSALKTALTALVDYGLASIGIPPSLPNFDQLTDMGVDYLATVAMQQAGIPAEDFIKEGVEDLAEDLSNEFKSSTEKSGQPNPLNWSFVKFDPDYLYRPAYIQIKIKNTYSTPTPAGRLFFRADKQLDSSLMGKDQATSYIIAGTGSTYVQVYKPIYGLEIPQLAPGQEITIPLILEEYVGVPFYNGGPNITENVFRQMYNGVGKFDFWINLEYDLPPIQQAIKEGGYTKEAIYSYSTTGTYITFQTEPYIAK